MSRTLVTIVRHGETPSNAQKIVQGHLDVPLNEQGEAQAAVVGRYLGRMISFDEAWSSDLSRASKTAQIILDNQPQAASLQQDPRIRERFLGDLQGKKRGDPGVDMSSIEPASELTARMFAFWDTRFPSPPNEEQLAAAAEGRPPRQVLVVSHGGSIKQFVNGLLAPSSEHGGRRSNYTASEHLKDKIGESVANCSVTVIEMAWDDSAATAQWRGRILSYSDESHFAESSRAPSPGADNADVVD